MERIMACGVQAAQKNCHVYFRSAPRAKNRNSTPNDVWQWLAAACESVSRHSKLTVMMADAG